MNFCSKFTFGQPLDLDATSFQKLIAKEKKKKRWRIDINTSMPSGVQIGQTLLSRS